MIVTAGSRGEAGPLLAVLGRRFLPNRVVAVTSAGDVEALAGRVPLVRGKRARRGATTAYVCERGACDLPTTDPAVFERQLAKVHPLHSPATAKGGP